MKFHLFSIPFLLILPSLLFSQNKKPIEAADVQRWKKTEQPGISNNGQWVVWMQVPVTEGDAQVWLWNSIDNRTSVFDRATEPRFSEDNEWLLFRIKPSLDSLKALRRKKVKEEDLPKDSLGIYHLADGKLEKIARLKTFAVPEKWSGYFLFQVEPEKPKPPVKDTSSGTKTDTARVQKPPAAKSAKKPKKEDKENGYRLILRNTQTGKQDTIAYVRDFRLAKKGRRLLVNASGWGDTLTFPCNPFIRQNGVYYLDLDKYLTRPLWRGKGKFSQLALDDEGRQAAFLLDADTTKERIPNWQLCFFENKDSSRIIANQQSYFLRQPGEQTPWLISENAKLDFSDNGNRLFFGIAPPPVLNDTTLLPEEIVNVEVWAWTESRIYTQQKAQLEAERKRNYPVTWEIPKNRFAQLGSRELPELRFQEQRDADLALGFTEEPYAQQISWEGQAHKDLYSVNVNTGDKLLIVKDLRCDPLLSPAGKFIAWWSAPDTAWFAWHAATGQIQQLTDNKKVKFYNEESDEPDFPDSYGLAGWLENDDAILVYDRFDIWNIDPAGKRKPQRLTYGREKSTEYRYIRLDPEEHAIKPDASILIHVANKTTKDEGYAWLDLKNSNLTVWQSGKYAYSKSPQLAKNGAALIYTRENFQVFPDLRCVRFAAPGFERGSAMSPAKAEIKSDSPVSNCNPQQLEYNWGSIELVEWTSTGGEKLRGLLVKPAGFDSTRQYPMIVNFYERMTDGLNVHRSPDFHRSQINFTVYASRGYLVFAPDISYRVGYPGESAYDAIVSGVTNLINKGFVDSRHIGIQGHSWGGYEAAYLITRTNLFACAEAGAPVANMTSAYGGIRWESGMSRAFQYEHTQSRIGGSLWEYPLRYIENSPLFALDKVQTPVLILSNDKDGAVPWYQGIEMYSGLRRLGKPCWLLNYNDEPHWPVKLQNRVDFQKRMQQFFDHYLWGAPEPAWMQRGVPPAEKGIIQGY